MGLYLYVLCATSCRGCRGDNERGVAGAVLQASPTLHEVQRGKVNKHVPCVPLGPILIVAVWFWFVLDHTPPSRGYHFQAIIAFHIAFSLLNLIAFASYAGIVNAEVPDANVSSLRFGFGFGLAIISWLVGAVAAVWVWRFCKLVEAKDFWFDGDVRNAPVCHCRVTSSSSPCSLSRSPHRVLVARVQARVQLTASTQVEPRQSQSQPSPSQHPRTAMPT